MSTSGHQRQKTIPAGSSAPSPQEDHPQTRADGGAEAGDQGGLWTVWHRRLWIHWCQGAEGRLHLKQINALFQLSMKDYVCVTTSCRHSDTGCYESFGVRTKEGGDQEDDQWSGQGLHRENLLRGLPRCYDAKNGNFIAIIIFAYLMKWDYLALRKVDFQAQQCLYIFFLPSYFSVF